MTTPETLKGHLHRVPRRPHAWIWLALGLHAGVALAWWKWGWAPGLAGLFAVHMLLLWGTMRPQSRLFSPVLSRLPITANAVWLTVDDGPSPETAALLDLLDRHQARATFFLVAERAAARPELAREILRRGHGIGNHSFSHPQAWFWALGPRRMAAQVDRAQATLRELTGQAPRWFRAVVGMANPFLSASLKKHGLARVAWSARGFDGVAGQPDKVVARIVEDLRPGAIVLLHEGAPHGNNLAIVEGVLRALDERGYRAVLPEELL
ncbi:MAG: polysaccharide deacetylase family protein [Lysobacteraceae bacterium]|nr:MAG: polysaccharide deacetylase family protein [Xanthomonadaceae bacterium]